MSPTAQRIAIVTALGWTRHRNSNAACGPSIPEGEAALWEYDFVPPEFKGDRNYRRGVPHYTFDLNAMHEAEIQFLIGGKFETKPMTYLNELEKIRHAIGQDWSKPSMALDVFFVMATASQRAEAFLKTIGKWEARASETIQTKEEA